MCSNKCLITWMLLSQILLTHLQPVSLMEDFLTLARANTQKNLETCGVLAGSLVGEEKKFIRCTHTEIHAYFLNDNQTLYVVRYTFHSFWCRKTGFSTSRHLQSQSKSQLQIRYDNDFFLITMFLILFQLFFCVKVFLILCSMLF